MAIFTQQEQAEVEARIAAAEQHTAAEIVVATVPRSDSYLDVRLFTAVLVGLGGSAAIHLLLPLVGVGELFALQILLGVLAFVMSGWPGVLRLLLRKERVYAAVAREAEVRFLEHAVFNTRDRNGVLILLSELEHGVTVLGDEGVHGRVQDAGWTAHVATIVKALRAGSAAEGVGQVIDTLAEVLAHHEPIRDDDANELDNRVRTH